MAADGTQIESRLNQMQLAIQPEILVDLFAGGGGASEGLEAAFGHPVHVAVNHNPVAIAVHAVNHPSTRHMISDVFEVCPLEATQGRPVGHLHASPDCTHHFPIASACGSRTPRQPASSLDRPLGRWTLCSCQAPTHRHTAAHGAQSSDPQLPVDTPWPGWPDRMPPAVDVPRECPRPSLECLRILSPLRRGRRCPLRSLGSGR